MFGSMNRFELTLEKPVRLPQRMAESLGLSYAFSTTLRRFPAAHHFSWKGERFTTLLMIEFENDCGNRQLICCFGNISLDMGSG